MLPFVSIITPTTYSREYFNNLCAELGRKQDYKGQIEHLFDFSGDTIGNKRNALIERAKGDIIIHADSDDYYAPDWITKSVEFLLKSGREITGLDKAYFLHNNGKSQLYRYKGSQYYAIGATLCYLKTAWAKGKFKNTSNGEDTYFLQGKSVQPHTYIDGFCATVHGGNTSGANKYHSPSFSIIKKEIPQSIMGDFFKFYYKY
jgi:glycosyltransferase involved in cell wall biosynthesis